MLPFDFLQKEIDDNVTIAKIEDGKTHNNDSKSLLSPFLVGYNIPQGIRELLWFADGKFKNFEEKKSDSNVKIHVFSSFRQEPSLIYSYLPINFKGQINPLEKIGYYPSYSNLNPDQRFVYLKWLCDISQKVDIGYVFIFYYGLERHLVYGKYKESVEMILKLREYHFHPSFNYYSTNALILASIIHQDKDTLQKLTFDLGEDYNTINNVLIGKYLLKIDLLPEDIFKLITISGFKNRRYIKEFPDTFTKHMKKLLKEEFGKESFPFHEIETNFSETRTLSFANTSMPMDKRIPELPDVIRNPDLKNALYQILKLTHNSVKIELTQKRKSGEKIFPERAKSVSGYELNFATVDPICPYCNKILEEFPQKKKKCRYCGNYIFVRKRPADRKKYLIREDEIKKIEEEWLNRN